MNINANPKLNRFYNFFETYGTERLNGLDPSYFIDLNENEKDEAWNFLKQGDSLSEESINGLYILDKLRAIIFFKEILSKPIKETEYPAQQQSFERNRILLLGYVNNLEPDKKYINAMCKFSESKFPAIRSNFAQALPANQITEEAIEALKKMIFTETERIPLSSAITKFMAVCGMDYQIEDPLYNSIYMALRSNNPKEKMSAISRLEKIKAAH